MEGINYEDRHDVSMCGYYVPICLNQNEGVCRRVYIRFDTGFQEIKLQQLFILEDNIKGTHLS